MRKTEKAEKLEAKKKIKNLLPKIKTLKISRKMNTVTGGAGVKTWPSFPDC